MNTLNESQQKSEEQTREELVSDNEKITKDAHRLAAEQEAQDHATGVKPIISSVADKIKDKLERNEFTVAIDEDGNHVAPRIQENE